jgi:hypothetical protein
VKRSDKIKQSLAAAQQEKEADTRTAEDRDAARREWGQIRRAAREAFLAGGDWRAILDGFREREGFYEASERDRMVRDYQEELIMNAQR